MSVDSRFIGYGLPYLQGESLPGKLIVIEGADCSGVSTQCDQLKKWLEIRGHAVLEAGIKDSKLMKEAIEAAKEELVLGRSTLGLLYATDFADSFENGIVPALRAGISVVADRYVYTLMARQMVRGAPQDWVDTLYGFAIRPDFLFYLEVPPEELLHRCFACHGHFSYWEAGMDMALSNDMFDSFLEYQARLAKAYDTLSQHYNFIHIDGTRSKNEIRDHIRQAVKKQLDSK
jgi:dTMP kinase